MAVPENHHVANLLEHIGHDFGTSKPVVLDQARIDHFAECTGDRQWIHVDVERARAESPFGGPIAHGFLTLAISNELLPQILEVRGVSLGVNYGVDRIRFPAPVPVGSRLRAGAELVDVSDVKGGIQTLVRITLEVEGGTKPVCIIDSLSRYLA
jgi:acyl dehydratase